MMINSNNLKITLLVNVDEIKGKFLHITTFHYLMSNNPAITYSMDDSDEEDTDFSIDQQWKIPSFDVKVGEYISNEYSNSTLGFQLYIEIENESDLFCLVLKGIDLKRSIDIKFNAKIFNTTKYLTLEDTQKGVISAEESELKIVFSKSYSEIGKETGYVQNDGSLTIGFVVSNNKSISYEYNPYNNSRSVYGPVSYGHSYVSYENSKESTGYVGLKNQGATCYMNSMLQSLYHIPAFRRLVYSFPTTGTEDPKTSIPLNLQRLFCSLQFSDKAASTTSLTESFGWGSAECFVQHDTHEFARVLLDNIETKLRDTPLQTCIADLFRGKFRSYIRCPAVQFESSRVEEFYDLQMMVSGCSNLEESFEKYVETEELNGKNQYQTDQHGKQDAIMGTEFVDFPRVMQLHLRRFDYDFDTNQQVKINDKFEFPEILDLTKFIPESEKKNIKSCKYQLHGVLVHSGSAWGGHYYAFLRTTLDKQWYEFNDSTVRKVSTEQAIDDNFGGKGGWGNKTHSAYILVYVRTDAVESVFDPIPNEIVPQHLQDYMKKAKEEELFKQAQKEQDLKMMTFEITTQDDLIGNTSRLKNGFAPIDKPIKIKIEKGKKYADVYNAVAEHLKTDVKLIRLWKASYMHTPMDAISYESQETVYSYYSTISLFCEKKLESEPHSFPIGSITIWAKFFSPKWTSPLQLVGTLTAPTGSTVSTLFPLLCEKLGIPLDTPLQAYEETSASPRTLMPKNTLGSYVTTGSCIIFEQQSGYNEVTPSGVTVVDAIPSSSSIFIPEFAKAIPVVDGSLLMNNDQSVNVMNYYRSNSSKLCAILAPVDVPDQKICVLTFPSNTSFGELKIMISKAASFEYDPLKDSIEIYGSDYDNPDLPSNTPRVLNYAIPSMTYSRTSLKDGEIHRIFFDVHQGITEFELSNTRIYNVKYSDDGYHITKTFRIRCDTGTKYREILSLSQEQDFVPLEGTFRVFEVWNHKIYKMLDPDSAPYYNGMKIRFDKIPIDQASKDCKVTSVAQGSLSQTGWMSCSGDPFFFTIIEGEPFSMTKKRLQEITKVEDEKWEKVKFFYSSSYNVDTVKDLISETSILSDIHNNDGCLYIVSSIFKETTSYSYTRTPEKGISIKN